MLRILTAAGLFACTACAGVSSQDLLGASRLDGFNDWDEATFGGVMTCSGEPFSGTIRMHTAGGDVSTKQGTRTDLHTNYQVQAAELTTGRQYVGSGTLTWSVFLAGNGASDNFYRSSGRLIATGNSPADDLFTTLVLRLQVNASGKVVHNLVAVEVICR